MQKDENHDARSSASPDSPSDSSHDASSDGSQPGGKLVRSSEKAILTTHRNNFSSQRDKLEKLVKWRIDQSSIEFPKGATQSRGGNATVSRAFLVSPSCVQSGMGQSNPTNNQGLELPGPAGETSPRSKVGASRAFRPLTVTTSLLSFSNLTECGGKENEDVGWPRADLRGKNTPVNHVGIAALSSLVQLTLREAECLVGLSHENIVKLEGFVEDLSKDVVWLVFAWEDNGTLQNFIASAEWEIPERISLVRSNYFLSTQI